MAVFLLNLFVSRTRFEIQTVTFHLQNSLNLGIFLRILPCQLRKGSKLKEKTVGNDF